MRPLQPRLLLAAAVATASLVLAPHAGADEPCDPCDGNCDGVHDQFDIASFVDGVLHGSAPCSACRGDFDGTGGLDGCDIQPLVDCLLSPPPMGACCIEGASCVLTSEPGCAGFWRGSGSLCQTDSCGFAQLTVYRPQHGAAYFPFAKTAVSEAHEEDSARGPGIRINAPGDSDPPGEDDLIEVLVQTSEPQTALSLHRTHAAMRIWTTRTKTAGTEIAFANDESAALPIGAGGSPSVWIEWAAAVHGEGGLELRPLGANFALDVLRFHSFRGIAIALGGESQAPSVPVDPNHGTFVVAISLYQQGYDVHMYDEDNVASGGAGSVYNEVVTAIGNRLVNQVALFGYSHGGGSTYDLANRLNVNRASIGTFEIVFTSYVDAVENGSDFDPDRELRRPPTSAFHANHYQRGTLADFFWTAVRSPARSPAPSGLDVETTAWGAGCTHYQVDDFPQVRDFVEANLKIQLTP